jgi:hypothetical protein
MNQTQIRTRHGLILQGIVGRALALAGFDFREDWQYDPNCEKPDFTIPDSDHPNFMFEVHQTDARNSFQMKILRAFTAVVEAKSHFGDDIISVNILFGDPKNEVPESNVDALYGFFDVNVVPRYAAKKMPLVESIEVMALKYAGDQEYNVQEGISKVEEELPEAIEEISDLLQKSMIDASCKKYLFPLWDKERNRLNELGVAPKASQPTYYKRMLIRSLYLTDEQFEELYKCKDPNKCSEETKKQLVRTKLAEVQEDIVGDSLILDSYFSTFLNDPNSSYLRSICESRLEQNEAMYWFFEDIRSQARRVQMVDAVSDILTNGIKGLIQAIKNNLESDQFNAVEHRRCWVADIIALIAGVSQNEFNRQIVQKGMDSENYQYPFNHITGKFERLMNCPEHFQKYSQASAEIFQSICAEKGINLQNSGIVLSEIETKLLELRIDGAIKLQRFNPLYEVVESVVNELGVNINFEHIKSLIFDLAGGRGRLGKYDAAIIKNSTKSILVVAVAVHDHHGDDKSKEWGARRRAILYRLKDGETKPSEFDDALFIIDGEWEDKDINRLHNSGWNRICRLGELENELCEIFGITKPVKSKFNTMIDIPDENDLPMAAED